MSRVTWVEGDLKVLKVLKGLEDARVPRDSVVKMVEMEQMETQVTWEKLGQREPLVDQAIREPEETQGQWVKWDLLVFQALQVYLEVLARKAPLETLEYKENVENRVCQDKEEHQELKEILVPMDPLDWMELKARREQRVTQVLWVLKDYQVLLDARARLVRMAEMDHLAHRVILDHLGRLDYLVALVQGEILAK